MFLNHLVKRIQPTNSIEFGNGYSAPIISNTFTKGDFDVKFNSIKNDMRYLDSTPRVSDLNSCVKATLVYAPLTDPGGNVWYELPENVYSRKFDLIIIDGPHDDRQNGLDFFKEIAHEDSIFVIDVYHSLESHGLEEICNHFPNYDL